MSRTTTKLPPIAPASSSSGTMKDLSNSTSPSIDVAPVQPSKSSMRYSKASFKPASAPAPAPAPASATHSTAPPSKSQGIPRPKPKPKPVQKPAPSPPAPSSSTSSSLKSVPPPAPAKTAKTTGKRKTTDTVEDGGVSVRHPTRTQHK
jgi:hypothetical protein